MCEKNTIGKPPSKPYLTIKVMLKDMFLEKRAVQKNNGIGKPALASQKT